jgi:hypothetical protein
MSLVYKDQSLGIPIRSRFASGSRISISYTKVLLRLQLQILLRLDKCRQLQGIGACPASHRPCVLTGTVSSVRARRLRKPGVQARIDAPMFNGSQVGCTTRQQRWRPERGVSESLSLPCSQYNNGYALFFWLLRGKFRQVLSGQVVERLLQSRNNSHNWAVPKDCGRFLNQNRQPIDG